MQTIYTIHVANGGTHSSRPKFRGTPCNRMCVVSRSRLQVRSNIHSPMAMATIRAIQVLPVRRMAIRRTDHTDHYIGDL